MCFPVVSWAHGSMGPGVFSWSFCDVVTPFWTFLAALGTRGAPVGPEWPKGGRKGPTNLKQLVILGMFFAQVACVFGRRFRCIYGNFSGITFSSNLAPRGRERDDFRSLSGGILGAQRKLENVAAA